MNLADSYVAYARYNRWMNEKLYSVAAQLSDEERKRDVKAFFHSVQGTLNHLLFADRVWLRRFGAAGVPATPAGRAAFGHDLYQDFSELRRERASTDAILDAWAKSLTDEALGATLHYSSLSGVPQEHPLWYAVQHLFNHQTHHRGQVTALLMQLGRDPGATDMIALLREPE